MASGENRWGSNYDMLGARWVEGFWLGEQMGQELGHVGWRGFCDEWGEQMGQ